MSVIFITTDQKQVINFFHFSHLNLFSLCHSFHNLAPHATPIPRALLLPLGAWRPVKTTFHPAVSLFCSAAKCLRAPCLQENILSGLWEILAETDLVNCSGAEPPPPRHNVSYSDVAGLPHCSRQGFFFFS